ncbi:conserved hypothetical protein [Arthrobacter sp. 9AX]|uniref:GAF domain-containing protein n=1 Tax=Arthrobacter sp. 9AX TaxID=2653131 RepID=UPI0012F18277|nr:GAF domain-containing protein [Arthrobacter sp. 9AX]VXB82016.1 conserved hypothetical protein [Arthrobacter sp. 9AX]
MDDEAEQRRKLIAMLVSGVNPSTLWPSLFDRSRYSALELPAFLVAVLALPTDAGASGREWRSTPGGTNGGLAKAEEASEEDAVAALGAAGRFLLTPRRAEAERLESLRETELLHSGPEMAYDRIVAAAQEYFHVGAASLSLIARHTQFLKSSVGPLRPETPRSIAFCSETVQRNSMLVINDTHTDPRFAANPLVVGEPYIRFYAGYPLHGPRGWNIGTLCIIDHKPRSFGPSEQQVLRKMAAMVQMHIDARA